jgi:murein DD-endopeptidase MepM/ murein hydrolase activator NlpD
MPAHHPWLISLISVLMLAPVGLAQSSGATCGTPALARLVRHKVAAGETLDSIAQRYNLIAATIMGFNPATRNGKVAVGETLQIPPFNGIQAEVPAGKTWRDVAMAYRIKPDVLFEVNGCQSSPRVVFVPGVNWSPVGTARSQTALANPGLITGSTLPDNTKVILKFGWYLNPQSQVVFHSGVDLAAAVGTPVRAAADGTVAFVGEQGAYGKLVVINHQQGYQSRYAQLEGIKVQVGQTVQRGQTIATVGKTGQPSAAEPHLHFELRSNSNLGWVAEDPEIFLRGQNR